jgi:glucosylceramidase
MKTIALCLLAAAVPWGACIHAQKVDWVASTANAPWVFQPSMILETNRADAPHELAIRLDRRQQTIEGWGGCFNELGWVALQSLKPGIRDEVLRNLFAPGVGLNFTICRMPVGASDYATNWYSLADTPGDFELEHFSLERDRAMLLPYIKAAIQQQPRLRVWGSPWSPPAWLKANQTYNSQGTNRMVQEKRYLDTHARYLAKYVRAYQAEGVDVCAVAIQNEPFASQVFPSCVWSPIEMRGFIANHLGPTFKRERINAEIWLGTFNNNQFAAFDTVLSDRRAVKYISAVGMQWAGKNALPELHERYPKLRKVQTETECGDGSCDWQAAEYTFSLMKHYFEHGVNLYTYWNMVLDDSGRSTWGWKQNALVVVNRESGRVAYTPEFYLFKHLGQFVPPGSVRVDVAGNMDSALAFSTPTGEVILFLANIQSVPRKISIMVQDRSFEGKLAARSFNTFRISGLAEGAGGGAKGK